MESFGPDEEYESGEEVEYVTLDLGTVEPALVPSSSSYRLIVRLSPTTMTWATCYYRGWTLRRHSFSSRELCSKGNIRTCLAQNSCSRTRKVWAGYRLYAHYFHLRFVESDVDRTRKPLVHVGTSERRVRFREVEVKAKTDKVPETTTAQTHVKVLPKGKNNKKDRLPETVEEVVGSANVNAQPRRRGGRRAKDSDKGKEKVVEPPDAEMDLGGRGGDQTSSAMPVPSHEDVDDPDVPAEQSSLGRLDETRSGRQNSLVQWSSDAPDGLERMDVAEG